MVYEERGERARGQIDLPDKSDQDTMADNVTGRVTAQIDVGSDDAAAVTAHDLHSDPRRALQATTNVISVPS